MKIGTIGFGNIARKHASAIDKNEDFKLVATCDPKIDASDVPQGVQLYRTVETLLDGQPGLDLIAVCTPNSTHEAYSIQLLKKGINVLCEKPLSLSATSCQNIQQAAKASQASLYCVMQNRHAPVSTWLKSLIDAGSLGRIYTINVACYWNRNEDYYRGSEWRGNDTEDGGTLFTQFSHYVDTLYWLFGPIDILSAKFDNFNHGSSIDFEDTGMFNFASEKGFFGSFMYTTACYEKNFESSIVIIAEKGTVKVDGQYMDKVSFCNVEGIGEPVLPPNDNIENLSSVYKACARMMQDPEVGYKSIHDGTEVVRIIESVYAFKQ